MGHTLTNNQRLIEGVFYEPLKQITDDRGAVFHHLNFKSPSYHGFEEVYISKTFPGKIKAWKKHLKMTQNFCVPVGKFKFVLYDEREKSTTYRLINEFIIDDNVDYKLLSIPPNIWYGFECLSQNAGLIVNLSNLLFDPAEVVKLEIENDVVPYKSWINLKL
jgi:dTDP-4-dehydrorhamnose 3,5-epimerase